MGWGGGGEGGECGGEGDAAATGSRVRCWDAKRSRQEETTKLQRVWGELSVKRDGQGRGGGNRARTHETERTQ